MFRRIGVLGRHGLKQKKMQRCCCIVLPGGTRNSDLQQPIEKLCSTIPILQTVSDAPTVRF